MAFLNMRGFTNAWFAAAIALQIATGAPLAPPPPEMQREYAIKSVFLYNFCQFIDWPDEAFESPSAPLVIGVFGEDPFGSLLEEAVQGETLRGRAIRIQRYRRPEDTKQCHLLFVSRSEAARLEAILNPLRGRSIVTVGETENFLAAGGMIALITTQNRVRLRINPAPIRAANLVVSSKLLRVADIQR
jgi:YfiR/HmsC-like